MTTVAWDGQVMAADRQLTIGGTPMTKTKIFRIGQDLVGCCGSAQESLQFVEWYKGGRDPEKKPTLNDGFAAMVISDGKNLRYEHLLMPYEIELPLWALGSGADYAIGAMAAGKNAIEAVEIACQYDVNSGMGIDVLEAAAKNTPVST